MMVNNLEGRWPVERGKFGLIPPAWVCLYLPELVSYYFLTMGIEPGNALLDTRN